MGNNESASVTERGFSRLKQLLDWWLSPSATSRDEAFRERMVRITLLIIISLAVLSLLSTVFVFRTEWNLISFPSLHVIVLALCAGSAFTIIQEKLNLSASTLLLAILAGASGLLLLGRQEGTLAGTINIIPVFMFVPLVTTLVLPRKYIVPSSIVSTIVYGISQYAIPIDSSSTLIPPVLQQIVSVLILLIAEGILLHRLRVEFDARLDAMGASLKEIAAAKDQAEEARQRAEQADQAKSLFLANMSHELRTPLNAIIGYDEAMLLGMAGDFTPKQRELLGFIQTNSRRLLNLINDVLDLSKIEAGSLETHASPMSPRKVIATTVDSLRSLAEEKRIDLRIEFGDEMPEVVLTDKQKIEQILVNLVGNAIKFTPEGSVTVKAQRLDKETWQMQVIDTGIGMEAAVLEEIFEPFQQVDGTLTRQYKGTGLGLSITKRLVDHLGGNIHVASTPGAGTTFSVSLPRALVPDEESGSAPPPQPQAVQ